MLVDPAEVATALGLAPESAFEAEPMGEAQDSPVRLRFCRPGVAPIDVLVRREQDDGRAANHLTLMTGLTRLRFPWASGLVTAVGLAAIEEWAETTSALEIDPGPGMLEAAVEALAALHGLPLREGLDWERPPDDLLWETPPPLYRLGFASAEREAAEPGFIAAREALLSGQWGFSHREATAARVRFAREGVLIEGFGGAGFGPQLVDVAAFLLTSGAEANQRRELACHYASLRGFVAEETADAVDLAGMLWGVEELLTLPRRLIMQLGDEAATEATRTAAARVAAGIRAPAGSHTAAGVIRRGLWGG